MSSANFSITVSREKVRSSLSSCTGREEGEEGSGHAHRTHVILFCFVFCIVLLVPGHDR
jgi:hypothetical protein